MPTILEKITVLQTQTENFKKLLTELNQSPIATETEKFLKEASNVKAQLEALIAIRNEIIAVDDEEAKKLTKEQEEKVNHDLIYAGEPMQWAIQLSETILEKSPSEAVKTQFSVIKKISEDYLKAEKKRGEAAKERDFASMQSQLASLWEMLPDEMKGNLDASPKSSLPFFGGGTAQQPIQFGTVTGGIITPSVSKVEIMNSIGVINTEVENNETSPEGSPRFSNK